MGLDHPSGRLGLRKQLNEPAAVFVADSWTPARLIETARRYRAGRGGIVRHRRIGVTVPAAVLRMAHVPREDCVATVDRVSKPVDFQRRERAAVPL
jgi:hypothetical protein